MIFTALTPVLLHILVILRLSLFTSAAFTQVTTADSSSVEKNANGTWCYYPRSKFQTDVACVGNDATFVPIMDTHLAQGVSISYYAPSLVRLGGAEYPVKTTTGVVYLCLSGRALDGKYVTQCEVARRDNEINSIFGRCAVEVAQEEVTDGCYELGLTAPASTASTSAGTRTSSATSGVTTSKGTPQSNGHSKMLLPTIWFAPFAAIVVVGMIR